MDQEHRAMLEEISAALYLCAGLLAMSAGWRVLSWGLFGKAALDTFCAFACWVKVRLQKKLADE